MKERPILFSGEMVRAILDGRKTMTRRAIPFCTSEPNKNKRYKLIDDRIWVELEEQQYDPRTKKTIYGGECRLEDNGIFYAPIVVGKGPRGEGNPAVCPYGKVGGRLWVRETFCELRGGHEHDSAKTHRRGIVQMAGRPRVNCIAYRADSDDSEESERCRIELGYKWKPSIFMPRWASRITLEIASVRVERLHEITEADADAEGFHREGCGGEGNTQTFARLWRKINGPESWDANPWVWVVGFKVVN